MVDHGNRLDEITLNLTNKTHKP